MLNIVIPLAGPSKFFNEGEYPFPKPLIEINGTTMIQHVIDNLNTISLDKNFIFIVKKEDCVKYHLDNVLRLLTNNKCEIVELENETKGAACSALMAVEKINNDNMLLISNGDQIIFEDFNTVINNFVKNNADAGTICFDSVHPKWSYVRLDEFNNVVETAEKRPISNYAIAGWYFFKKGQNFVNATMKSIKNDASVNGLYYIAPTLNEMILSNKTIRIHKIEARKYYSFYSPEKIKEFDRMVSL
jgi:dTDP-glucose pyrophosphorylase